jgi:transcriptional regulator with XRE-family HTH domain
MRDLRFARGLRQQELADRLGCERSYVSALETDAKQAPPAAFVDALSKALVLAPDEDERLRHAHARSRRRYAVPAECSAPMYELVYELFARLERLNTLQQQGILAFLRLGDVSPAPPSVSERRIRRKDRGTQRDKEDAM